MKPAIARLGRLFSSLDGCQLGFSRCCGLLFILSFPQIAWGQIVEDRTLPHPSRVVPNGSVRIITGGTTAGNNLFHSFSQFNVLTGEIAYFNNGTEIQNIIARISGGQSSQIDGLIRANGTANLFLINPSGITFGKNAALAVGGSFFASSADSLLFSDGSAFSATDPNTPALLSVNVPMGLQLGANPGAIANRSQASSLFVPGQPVGLEVFPGQTLGLIGGDLGIEGGYLTAWGGKIELFGGANSTFTLNSSQQAIAEPRTIQLSQGAIVDTRDIPSLSDPSLGLGGGEIVVGGGQVTLTQGSSLLADTIGPSNGRGIEIQATHFKLDGGSYVSTSTFSPTAAAGDLSIRAEVVELIGTTPLKTTGQLLNQTFDPLTLSDGLYSLSVGNGAGGTIRIDAERLWVRNGANILTTTIFDGAGGDLLINASQLAEFANGSLIFTGTVNSGEAGDFVLQAGQLRVLDGTALGTTPGPGTSSRGRGGNLTAIADAIELRGTPANAPVPGGLFTTTLGAGAAGNLKIATNELIAADGAQVSAASSGAGRGGNVQVNARQVELSGLSADGRFLSGIFASAGLLTVSAQRGIAGAGDLTVNAERVQVRDGAQISVATGGEGSGGRLRLNVSESVEVSGFATGVNSSVETVSFGVVGDGIVPSAIESNTRGAGNAGNVEIVTRRLTVRDGAEVGVRGRSSGAAGDLEIWAESIRLENRGMLSATTSAGAGGNLNIQASDIILRNNSRIATDAGNTDGGNISINTKFLLAREEENSDITANAQQGRGGQVAIAATGVFGIEFREALTAKSDITATSDLGAAFSGIVNIQTLGIDPSSGINELPADFIDPANQIASECATYAESRFIITGRGGLPENPTIPLQSQTLWRDLQDFSGDVELSDRSLQSPSPQSPSPSDATVEATGWIVNAKGNIELVANLPPGTGRESASHRPDCSEK